LVLTVSFERMLPIHTTIKKSTMSEKTINETKEAKNILKKLPMAHDICEGQIYLYFLL
jgi:hypothetical protein